MKIKFRSVSLLLVLCSIPILISCHRSIVNRSTPSISFSVSELSNGFPTNIDSIFSAFDFISLETSKDALLGRINKIEVHDGLFFIGDETGTNRLMLFTNEGAFIKQVGNPGKGPEEYIVLTDFTVDRVAHEVLLLCAQSKSILVYNFEGKFIRRIKLKIENNLFGPNKIGALNYFYYVESIGMAPNLAVFDGKGNLIGQHFKNERGLIHLNLPLTISPRGLIYHKPFNDTIYAMNKEMITPIVYVDYGNYKIDYDTFEQVGVPNPVYPSYREMPEEYCELGEVFVLNQHIVLVTGTEGDHFLSIASFSGHLLKSYKASDFKQIMGISLYAPMAGDEDDFLYGFYYPHQIEALLKCRNNSVLSRCQKLSRIDASNNPIIMKYKFHCDEKYGDLVLLDDSLPGWL